MTYWKVRPENLQDEYGGKLAPRVTKRQSFDPCIAGGDRTTRIAPHALQEAWLGAALEELAQMCGAFLGATVNSTPKTPLNIDIHVGDALDFCDVLLSGSSMVGDGSASTINDGVTMTSPVAFQQSTLQPLHLRAGVFGGIAPTFDVIKSSNLADHLGG